jgi:hypothetical protein
MRSILLTATLLALPLAACGGDPALDPCARDLRCSPDAPNGLYFTGPGLGDRLTDADAPIDRVAVGGREIAVAHDNKTGKPIDVTSAPSFDGDQLEAKSASKSEIELTAKKAGDDELHLDDAEGRLLDKVVVRARDLKDVGVIASDEYPRVAPGAAWAGAQVHLTVALTDKDGERLVDQGLTVTGTGAQSTAWDTVQLTVPAGGVALQVKAAGASAKALAIDALADAHQLTATDVSVVLGDKKDTKEQDQLTVCMHGKSAKGAVIGLPWQVAVTGPAHTVDGGSIYGHNCVDLKVTGTGDVTVSASLTGGSPASATFPVSPKTKR